MLVSSVGEWNLSVKGVGKLKKGVEEEFGQVRKNPFLDASTARSLEMESVVEGRRNRVGLYHKAPSQHSPRNVVIMGLGVCALAISFGYIAYMRSKYEGMGYYSAVSKEGEEQFLQKKSKHGILASSAVWRRHEQDGVVDCSCYILLCVARHAAICRHVDMVLPRQLQHLFRELQQQRASAKWYHLPACLNAVRQSPPGNLCASMQPSQEGAFHVMHKPFRHKAHSRALRSQSANRNVSIERTVKPFHFCILACYVTEQQILFSLVPLCNLLSGIGFSHSTENDTDVCTNGLLHGFRSGRITFSRIKNGRLQRISTRPCGRGHPNSATWGAILVVLKILTCNIDRLVVDKFSSVNGGHPRRRNCKRKMRKASPAKTEASCQTSSSLYENIPQSNNVEKIHVSPNFEASRMRSNDNVIRGFSGQGLRPNMVHSVTGKVVLCKEEKVPPCSEVLCYGKIVVDFVG
ncbi:hypothetical protein PR048_033336 [Dryococelus australis]|uniref:Uncharacterized protein n=1 Tax=Dryococelus australis TaxID=614101 RepID=A0ABQ9G466_9NEOP|nr:hypothetical protein PR048_033336 [Dryococelus australis]